MIADFVVIANLSTVWETLTTDRQSRVYQWDLWWDLTTARRCRQHWRLTGRGLHGLADGFRREAQGHAAGEQRSVSERVAVRWAAVSSGQHGQRGAAAAAGPSWRAGEFTHLHLDTDVVNVVWQHQTGLKTDSSSNNNQY